MSFGGNYGYNSGSQGFNTGAGYSRSMGFGQQMGSMGGGSMGGIDPMMLLLLGGRGGSRKLDNYFRIQEQAINEEFRAQQRLINVQRGVQMEQFRAQRSFDPARAYKAQYRGQVKTMRAEYDAMRTRGRTQDSMTVAQSRLYGLPINRQYAKLQRAQQGDWTAWI